ncbi:MAG: hypothetical protein ACMUIA_00960 [bacterium]
MSKYNPTVTIQYVLLHWDNEERVWKLTDITETLVEAMDRMSYWEGEGIKDIHVFEAKEVLGV